MNNHSKKNRFVSKGRWVDYTDPTNPVTKNKRQKISDSKFESFDRETEIIKLRFDHDEWPEFWMESIFDLETLSNWLLKQGVYADFKMFPASDEESTDENTYESSVDDENNGYSSRDVHYKDVKK